MSMPVLKQSLTVICSRSVFKKYLVAATSIILATSIGTCPAFAKESTKETKKPADTKSAAVSDNSQWDSYCEELEKQVLGKWFPPRGIANYKDVTVEIRIRKDGRLSRSNMIKSSQIVIVDEAVTKTVKDAAPYKPFPDGVKEEFATFEVRFDKSDKDLKRRLVRKIDKFSKPEKLDARSKQAF